MIRPFTAGRSNDCRFWKRSSGGADGSSTRPATRSISAARLVGQAVAGRYFRKAIDQNGEPEVATIGKSGSNLATGRPINVERETSVKIRQKKCLNNIVEQDPRAITRCTRLMLGFKNFHCARIVPGRVDVMHMISKEQMKDGGVAQTSAQ